MKVLPGPTKSNQVLAWSPDGRFVVAGGPGDGVMAWDVTAGTRGERVLNSGHGGRLMRFCPHTGRLFVAFQTGGFWHWDPNTSTERRSLQPAQYSLFYGMAPSGDGRAVVLDYYHSSSRAIVGYTVTEDGLRESWARDNSRWNDVQSFVFRPGTDELFGIGTHTSDRQRFEWIRPEDGEVVGSIASADARGVRRWALAPDGERVAWVTDQCLYLRRLDSSAALELPAAKGEIRRGIAFHPDGRTLAYTTGTTVRLLDADTFAEVRAFDWGTGKARAVAFSPDGLRAAVSAEGGKGYVTVFDLE
jgi:WD40 repeat protein